MERELVGVVGRPRAVVALQRLGEALVHHARARRAELGVGDLAQEGVREVVIRAAVLLALDDDALASQLVERCHQLGARDVRHRLEQIEPRAGA